MPINDYWNPDEYRERLRRTVSGQGLPGQAPTGQGPMVDPGALPQPQGGVTNTTGVVGQQFGQPVRGAALQPAMRRQRQPAQQPVFGGPFGQEGPPQSQQKQKIPTAPPDWQPKVDEDKLAKAKNFPEVMDAMDRSSQTEYMDWWEKQYGSINAKWNKVQEDIGDRPDPRRKLSRRDKFDMLMEFGLNLMRASSPEVSGGDTTQAMTSAFHDTVRGQQANRYGEQVAYDQALAGADAGRAAELKELGNRGAALKDAADVQQTDARTTDLQARPGEIVDVMDTSEGKIGRTRGGALSALKSPETGKTLRQDPSIGARGGAIRDSRPVEEKRFEHLTSLGLPEELAMRIAYKQSSGDPRKDYKDVFRTAMTSNFGNDKKAKQIADAYLEFTYGADTQLDQRDQPILPAQNDPLGIR